MTILDRQPHFINNEIQQEYFNGEAEDIIVDKQQDFINDENQQENDHSEGEEEKITLQMEQSGASVTDSSIRKTTNNNSEPRVWVTMGNNNNL